MVDRRLLEHWRSAPGDVMGAIFAHSAMLALSLDADGRVRRQSAAMARLTGRPDAEIAGRRLADLMHKGAAHTFEAVILPELLASGSVDGVDLDLLDAAGGTVPVRLSALCEYDAEGRFVRAVAFLADQRETAAALEALDRKAAEAEEASEAKTRFLAAMSHEIRTPMNAILGFAQLLDMTDLDATRRGHVRAIKSAGEALMALLSDLLDLSQVEAGRMRVALEAFELPGLLEEVARWWRPAATQKGLELTVTMAPDVPRHIVSDRGRIGQVLNNYIGNAVKFTPAGRIELAVEMHAPEPGAAPRIRFRVSDTGPGIAPQDIERLYKPFMQIEGQRREGWGLGLSICASIAQAMGAEVGVESEPGRGSVFRFDLPARVAAAPHPGDEPAAAQGPTVPPAAPRPSGRHILLAEDNALNQQVMRQMLADMGHAVTVAANGFEALEVLERGGIDLVLMDVMMPGLGGVGATRQLRASDWPARDIPVIACSAHVSPDAEARYREIGMTAFLPKPVDRAELEAAIDTALNEATDGPVHAV